MILLLKIVFAIRIPLKLSVNSGLVNKSVIRVVQPH